MADLYVGVVGTGGYLSAELARVARDVGRLIAERNAILICGGLGGAMEAAAAGAHKAGGRVVGILPGASRTAANAHLSISIPTGLGEARNALVVRASDVLIAVGGEYGTLSEIALALKIGRPVVGVGTWELKKGGREVSSISRAETAEDAVHKALLLAKSSR